MPENASDYNKIFLTAEWRDLVMLNFEVPASAVLPDLPKGTELDTYDGVCMASIVAFRFLNTRVLGIPVPFHRDFDEVNLRFYNKYKAVDGWRRGVCFIKEIVPKRAVAAVARGVYGENYAYMPMRSKIKRAEGEQPNLFLEYGWRFQGDWSYVKAESNDAPTDLVPGSEAEFITEHYWGYTSRKGTTHEYRVAHPRWKVWDVKAGDYEWSCDVKSIYGEAFAEALSVTPRSVFIADGSAIEVHQGSRII